MWQGSLHCTADVMDLVDLCTGISGMMYVSEQSFNTASRWWLGSVIQLVIHGSFLIPWSVQSAILTIPHTTVLPRDKLPLYSLLYTQGVVWVRAEDLKGFCSFSTDVNVLSDTNMCGNDLQLTNLRKHVNCKVINNLQTYRLFSCTLSPWWNLCQLSRWSISYPDLR